MLTLGRPPDPRTSPGSHHDPHGTPVITEGSFGPDYGGGFSQGEERLRILPTADRAATWAEPAQDTFEITKTKLCTFKQ